MHTPSSGIDWNSGNNRTNNFSKQNSLASTSALSHQLNLGRRENNLNNFTKDQFLSNYNGGTGSSFKNIGNFSSNENSHMQDGGIYGNGGGQNNYNSQQNSNGQDGYSFNPNGNNTNSNRDNEWLKIEVCRDHIRGVCKRSEDTCRYGHPPIDQTRGSRDFINGKVVCCFDNLKNKCRRENCKYFHPPPHLKAQIEVNGKQALIREKHGNSLQHNINNFGPYDHERLNHPRNYNKYTNNNSNNNWSQGDNNNSGNTNSHQNNHKFGMSNHMNNNTSGRDSSYNSYNRRDFDGNRGQSNYNNHNNGYNSSRQDSNGRSNYNDRNVTTGFSSNNLDNSNSRSNNNSRMGNNYNNNGSNSYGSRYNNNNLGTGNNNNSTNLFNNNTNSHHSKHTNTNLTFSNSNGPNNSGNSSNLMQSSNQGGYQNHNHQQHNSLMNNSNQSPFTNIQGKRPDRLEVCRDYLRNSCSRNDNDCKYAHPHVKSMIDQTDNCVIVCMDSVKKRCNRDQCKYFHPPSHLILKVKQMQQAQQLNNSSMAGPALPDLFGQNFNAHGPGSTGQSSQVQHTGHGHGSGHGSANPNNANISLTNSLTGLTQSTGGLSSSGTFLGNNLNALTNSANPTILLQNTTAQNSTGQATAYQSLFSGPSSNNSAQPVFMTGTHAHPNSQSAMSLFTSPQVQASSNSYVPQNGGLAGSVSGNLAASSTQLGTQSLQHSFHQSAAASGQMNTSITAQHPFQMSFGTSSPQLNQAMHVFQIPSNTATASGISSHSHSQHNPGHTPNHTQPTNSSLLTSHNQPNAQTPNPTLPTLDTGVETIHSLNTQSASATTIQDATSIRSAQQTPQLGAFGNNDNTIFSQSNYAMQGSGTADSSRTLFEPRNYE